MHPELKQKISALQKEIKRLQQEHSDAESKLIDVFEPARRRERRCGHAFQTESPSAKVQ